ncbi:SCP-like protein, partial [Ancylostoma caninum]
AFGCKNAMIADEWRDMVLNLHNSLRKKLARGTVQGQANMLPVGKNIKQLYWDCNLEDMVRAEAEKCPTTAPTPQNFGVSLDTITTKATGCNATAVVEAQIKKWWKEGAAKQADQAKIADNNFFSQMAYSESDSFACTYHPCSSSKMSLLCYYSQDGNKAPANLYENGAADTEICGSCAANTCIDALCNVAPAAVAPADVLCQDAANTQKALMTDTLRNQALHMHNYYRRLLASGWAKDGKIMYAKPSNAMPALTYDCNMEEKIMVHLKDCAGTAATTNIAQNFKDSGDFQDPREDILEKAIQDWWAPLEATGIEDNLFTSTVEGSALKTYVPMAHHLTTKVGCGVHRCDKIGKTLVQCAYEGAPTAADDDAIYPTGKPCSKCKALTGTPNCSPLGALCVA